MKTPVPTTVRTTKEFKDWQASLRDEKSKAIIDARIKRLQFGNRGDVRPVGEGVSELRIDFGPGLRVYFSETHAGDFVLLLAGGDKSAQHADIKRARQILRDLKAKQAKEKAEAASTGRKP